MDSDEGFGYVSRLFWTGLVGRENARQIFLLQPMYEVCFVSRIFYGYFSMFDLLLASGSGVGLVSDDTKG